MTQLSILLSIEVQACKSLLRYGTATLILVFSGSQTTIGSLLLHCGGFTNKIHLGMPVV